MNLYRVFPYDASAAADEPGGALFVPVSSGRGRVSNPDLYDELYLATAPEGAIAETFGRIPQWRSMMLRAAGGLPYALASYELPDDEPLANLNDVHTLERLGLRPTEVITRDRRLTQAWARVLFKEHRWRGITWWSYYRPQWTNLALWNVDRLTVRAEPEALTIASPVLVAAAEAIVRTVVHPKPPRRPRRRR